MAMRDLIAGGAACAVPGSSSSSNPLGALANKLLGSSSKAQELAGLPGTSMNVPSSSQAFGPQAPMSMIPGSEFENHQYQQPGIQSSQFLRGFHSAEHGGLEEAWNDVQQPQFIPPSIQGRESQAHFQEFEQIYDQGATSNLQPAWDGPPQRVLSNFLHAFVESGRAGLPLRPVALPVLGLSKGDKQCIRDRSYIMARHMFADRGEEYIHSQVNALLHSLDIDGDERVRGPLPGRMPEFEEYWTESQVSRPGMAPGADSWITEFSQHRHEHSDPEAWANSFEKIHGANGWASEFDHEQAQRASMGQMDRGQMSNIEAMEQTRMLAHTLAQNSDPKIQNSKFLQFVSKMSRGELIVDDNQVKPATGTSGDWAEEYQMQYNATPEAWASEFSREEVSRGPETWANEYADEHQETEEQWANEFSKLHVDDWADEFGKQMGEGLQGDSTGDNWADTYDRFLNEQQKSDPSKGIYVFSDLNPYVGHAEPFKEGQELFRKGLLSEAVLALEAEVLKNPENAEAWRLLGIAHAENDDDQQAISSMLRAQEADPRNLEVLLALGVSHTNELEQASALKYLHGWLQNHPKYGSLTSQGQMEALYHADVARLFNEAAQMSPEDSDIHIVLGVLYNLSREYDKAINSFKTALKLKPQDYSLWNKLGATQANSVQSADAILAYQQALDLKPNYVRAWANMGISYANQGLYAESIRFYVKALSMNPKADNAWQYLRISLSCASRNDMFDACDSRNLELLQKEFPL
ncbi:peroxin 5 [Wolffia australiana]